MQTVGCEVRVCEVTTVYRENIALTFGVLHEPQLAVRNIGVFTLDFDVATELILSCFTF